MELRTITYFLAIAEHGSLTAAAQACFVTQPSLSRQVAELERELGVTLFRRTASGLKLNQAGERFMPIARDIARRVGRGTNLMRSLGSGSLDLVVACPVTVMDHVITPYLAETGAPIGDVREFEPTAVYPQLDHGGADLAIGSAAPPDHLEARKLMTVGISVQAAAGTFGRGRDTIGIDELAEQDLIVVRRGSSIRQMVDDAAAGRAIPLRYTHQVSSSTVAQALAAAGRGFAVVAAPPRFDLDTAMLVNDDGPIGITDWAAWDPAHYAAPEIETVAAGIAAWILDHAVGLDAYITAPSA